jgi:hypothetical protein
VTRVEVLRSLALIAVPSLDEPREFVRSRRLGSLPDSAARALQEAGAATTPRALLAVGHRTRATAGSE